MEATQRRDDAPPVLEARGLGHDYGNTPALADLNLKVPAGQVCALLGANGAGKSTFIHASLGLLRPKRGWVRLLDAPAGSRAARRATGAMLQDADLSDSLTPREQLELFAAYYGGAADIDAVISSCAIEAFADTRYKRLSGGQQRRAQFAVALLSQPQLLFLDEPTTGLDAQARAVVWDQIRRLASRRCTIILTTHYLEEADALADRVVVLRRGQIIADDSAAAIRRRSGGALIRCRTQLPPEEAAALPGVTGLEQRGRLLLITCEHAPSTLRALLAADLRLDELEVVQPTLEAACAALMATKQEGRR